MKVDPIIDKQTIREFMEYLEAKNPKYKLFFAIGIYTGLRASDIRLLKVKQIYKRNYITVKQKKTGKYVDIPINKELKKMVRTYCEGKKQYEYLFLSRQKNSKGVKGPITVGQMYKVMKEAADYVCTYENIATHTMRKIFGYNLYTKKKDIGEVMIALGQRDTGSTLRYIGLTEMNVQKSIQSLTYFD